MIECELDPESCGSCRYWNELPEHPAEPLTVAGQCRRSPPTLIPKPRVPIALLRDSLFPVTESQGWCGEYARDAAQGDNR